MKNIKNDIKMEISKNQYYTLEIDKENKLAMGIWHEATALMSDEDFVNAAEYISQVAYEYGADKLIIDSLHFQKIITLEIQTSMATRVGPLHAKSGLKRLAHVRPADFITELAVEQTADEVKSAGKGNFAVKYFTTLVEAKNWITS